MDIKTRAENRCLDCGTKLDACRALKEGHLPGDGDLSVCIRCGALMFFTADLTFRRLTPKEAFEMEANFEVQSIVSVVKQTAR